MAANKKDDILKSEMDEEKLKSVLDNAIIHIWAFDGKKYFHLNREWYKYTGQNPNLPNTIERWTEVVHPDDLNEEKKKWFDAWNKKEVYNSTFRLKNAKGKYKTFQSYAVPIYDKLGKFHHYQGYNIDITEQKKCKDTLKQSEEKYRILIENVQDGIFMIKDGKLIYVNDAFAKITGYTIKELMRMSFVDLVAPQDKKMIVDRYIKLLADKRSQKYALKGLRKNSKKIFTVYIKSDIFEYQGNAIAFGTVRDITEYNKVKEKLEESEEKFRTIFEGANEGILGADLKTKKFIFANQAICKITGYSLKELLKLDVTKIHPREDLLQVLRQFKKQVAGEITLAKDMPVLRKDKKVVYCDIDSTVMEIEGQECLIGFFRDVTQNKEAENILRKSESRYRAIVEDIDALVCRFLPDGTLTFVNSNYCKYFKKKPNNMIGYNFFNFIPKKERERVRNHFMSLNKEKPRISYEHKVIMPDGKIRWQEWTDRALFDEDGKVIEFQSFGLEITERKNAEEELKESEEKYRLIYETSSDAIMTLEPPEWNFTSGNQAMIKMFKLKDEKDFTSLAPWEISPKYQPDGQLSEMKAKKMIEIAMEKGMNFFEWTHKRINGEEFFATVLLNKVESGGKTFLQARVIDISEQKKAAEKIKSLNARLQEYAKQLEHKVKFLEKGKIALTHKEKLVLYGICANPLLNDEKLAQKLKLKRSTVTAIKNRLKNKNWFKIINIPNLYAIGCDMLSLINADFNMPLKERRELGIVEELKNCPELIFDYETDNSLMGLFTAQKYSCLQRFMENSQLLKQKVIKQDMTQTTFFYDLNLVELFDYSSLLNKLFELNLSDGNKRFKIDKNEKCRINNLNNNERRVFSALIKHPELSVTEIAKKIWKSKPTVRKIKKRLIEGGYIFPLVIPDLSKLIFSLFTLVSFEVDSQIGRKIQMLEYKLKEPQIIMKIIGNKKVTKLGVWKNYEEFETELKKLKNIYDKNDIEFRLEVITFPLQKKHLFQKLDFAALTDKLLFPEDY